MNRFTIEQSIIDELKKRNLSYLVDHVVVVGDNRKFISVLVFPSDVYLSKSSTFNIDMNYVLEKINDQSPNNSSIVKKYLIINKKLKNW